VTVAPAADAATLAALRERLAAAGYDEGAVHRVLTAEGTLPRRAGEAVLHLRPAAGEPLAVLVRLFAAGEAVDEAVAAAALAPAAPAELERAGLLERAGGAVRALLQLEECDGLLVAADRGDTSSRPDHVLGFGPSTQTLARLTVRRPAETALDLGTGAGTHALLAARHAARVVGTDLNPRALELAELNARLNGVANVEWRQGDLAEPVRGEAFDLVVANPPYVVTPGRDLLYRDGGGDAISQAFVTAAAAHLREGGFASVLCSWVREPGDSWADRPRRWLEGSGCDAWLLHFGTADAAAYAASWSGRRDAPAHELLPAVESWLEHHRRAGIEAIATGAVVLRRRSGPSWVRSDEAAFGLSGSASDQILNVFAAGDFLAAAGSARALLAERLAPAEGARLLRRADFRGGRLVPERVRLAPPTGVRTRAPLPGRAAAVLLALDGGRPLAEALERAAPDAGVSPEALAAECLPALRELFALGLLVRMGPASSSSSTGSGRMPTA
jgi:methylase of polypeptide subunit release factors